MVWMGLKEDSLTDRPALYRLTVEPRNPAATEEEVLAYEVLDLGVLVPVELCEHGFHTSHWVVDVDRYGFPVVTVFCNEAGADESLRGVRDR